MYFTRAILIALVSLVVAVGHMKEPLDSQSSAFLEISKNFPEAGTKAGVWVGHGLIVATGISSSIVNFGETRNQRIGEKLALVDAKERILKKMAKKKVGNYDPAIHDVEGTFGEIETVRLDSRSNGEEWVTISLPFRRLVVSVKYNIEKARGYGFSLFNSKEWGKSASVFAQLTREGVQDPKTVAMALAASAHVNLDSGVKGEPRFKALEQLGKFYISQNKPEESLKYYFQIYSESPRADSELLRRLVSLCEVTHRPDDSKLFLEELNSQ